MRKILSEDVTPFLRTEDSYNYHYFNGKIKSEHVISKLSNYCIVRPGSIYGIDYSLQFSVHFDDDPVSDFVWFMFYRDAGLE